MKCYICGDENISEEHHLIPRSRGGEKGPTIYLCVKHHKQAHYLAISKRPLNEINNSKLRKIVKIIRIANATLKHADKITLSFEIPYKLHQLIKREARSRKKSIPWLITLIIAKYFKERV